MNEIERCSRSVALQALDAAKQNAADMKRLIGVCENLQPLVMQHADAVTVLLQIAKDQGMEIQTLKARLAILDRQSSELAEDVGQLQEGQ